MIKKKLLLHICCAGCGAYVSQVMKKEGFEVLLYFFNPNIFPKTEYDIRKKEVEDVAKKFALDFFMEEYDHESWMLLVKGMESEPEKGRRCVICYEDRLERTAKKAEMLNCQYFTSTLSVSPYKVVKEINRIGEKLSKKYSVEFLARDFKKQDGFKKASKLSRELNLYRQNYCGCEFSKTT